MRAAKEVRISFLSQSSKIIVAISSFFTPFRTTKWTVSVITTRIYRALQIIKFLFYSKNRASIDENRKMHTFEIALKLNRIPLQQFKKNSQVKESEECRYLHKKDCSEFNRVLVDLSPEQSFNFLLAVSNYDGTWDN